MNEMPRLLTSETAGGWLAPLAVIASVALCGGLAMALFVAPEEATMGVVQRIFYFHVPSAIMAYAGFLVCCAASVVYLVTGAPRADVFARAGAELGVLFCAAVLISGPLWARKAWGTFWTGEPRLLLTLVLWLIFVAYLVVRHLGGRSEMTRKICALLAILGVADIPLIRVAVQRWRGNHPRVVQGGGLDPEMMQAFLAMIGGVSLVFVVLLLVRVRLGEVEEDIEAWHRALFARQRLVEGREG